MPDSQLHVKMDAELKSLLEEAAAIAAGPDANPNLSGWARATLRREAVKLIARERAKEETTA